MSKKTKIKKDSIGLYVVSDLWILRPLYGTIFKEDDIVKSHYFKDRTFGGVTTLDNNFKSNGIYEYWGSSGVDITDYDNKSMSEVRRLYTLYKNESIVNEFINHNKSFKIRIDDSRL